MTLVSLEEHGVSVANAKWVRWEIVEKEIREVCMAQIVYSPGNRENEFDFWEFGAKQWDCFVFNKTKPLKLLEDRK